ncbi:MAG: chromosome segregation protein SMC [Nitrosomonas sp.]|nr:chromosome segregation protein SMC [Nitrosomonas sp.]
MRLAHIKLAGFKSFVDPTVIPVSQDLVGIVGPNGCGKSNIIDAVRWVLGESKASALRGDSMEDVIFAGSDQRKAVNRASVEIVFDNQASTITGQWASYSEIAIKRVLQRDKGSNYYINNLQVRRRDISDLFLGTGIGGRGYAIIEQGMISRIIEAKPHELKSFLEEAAGITQYRERRQETSSRLVETRKNLLRLEDICRELETQLDHLSTQAEIAARYQSLQEKLLHTQSLLWLQRKTDALNQRNEAEQEIHRLETALDTALATQHEAEQNFENARASEYAITEQLLQTQGQLYSVDAEIGRLEQERNFLSTTMERLTQQIQEIANRLAGNLQFKNDSVEKLLHWQQENAQAEAFHSQCILLNEEENNKLPGIETELQRCQEILAEHRHHLFSIEQSGQLEASHRTHAEKNIQQLEIRHARLIKERDELIAIESERLNKLTAEMNEGSRTLETLALEHNELEQRLAAANQSHKTVSQQIHDVQHTLSQATARYTALNNLQQKLDDNQNLITWLNNHQLNTLPRLWQKIEILPEWETALEAVLFERLNSIELDQLNVLEDWIDDLPSGKWAIFEKHPIAKANHQSPTPANIECTPLINFITVTQPEIAAVLTDWLRWIYVIGTVQDALSKRHTLHSGEVFLTRQGHMITRASVTFYAPTSQLHGVLSRQQELKNLHIEINRLESALDGQRTDLETLTRQTKTVAETLARSREKHQQVQQRRHNLQLEIVKLTQINERTRHRTHQITTELTEIKQALETEQSLQHAAMAKSLECRQQAEARQELIRQAQQAWNSANQSVNAQRQRQRESSQQLQHAFLQTNACMIKIKEIESKILSLDEEMQQLTEARDHLLNEKKTLPPEPLDQLLESARTNRTSIEASIREVREQAEETARNLRDIENIRMTSEQQSYALRDAINQARLKEQAASITIAQFDELISNNGVDTEALTALIGKKSITSLQAEINRFSGQISALGPVNLAALEELSHARSRQSELLAQTEDLTAAIATLENVIQRIDRETQLLLQKTFDAVNQYLNEIFPVIFGGGHAKLELSDGRILDAGLLLMAQPPGKKNSSIHLLSGGEKALTALALIFSLFRLNPAPFCLLDEVDAPLDDSNTNRFCDLVKNMSAHTQFLFISHNKITMEMAQQLVGVTMQEQGVSRIVTVDIADAIKIRQHIEQPVT